MWTLLRSIVVFVVLALVIFGAPLAWAFSNCPAMGGMCEGPCGAASCAALDTPSGPTLALVASLSVHETDDPPSAILRLLELPPKSSLLPV